MRRRGNREVTREKEELIELRHLRYFIALAEELHFARAAERLQMEQSPLSRAIRDMERLLGVRLFERNTRSTRITRAGGVLLEYARRAVALVEQAKSSTRSAALGHSQRLRVGLSDCIAYHDFAGILTTYQSRHPDVLLSMYEMPLAQQIAAIRDDLLDASISLNGCRCKGIEAEPVGRDFICAVLPTRHVLTQGDVVQPTDLSSYPLILFSADSDLGGASQIEHFVGTLGKPYIAARAGSLGTLLTLVALGHGIGLVGYAQMTGVRRPDVELRTISGARRELKTFVLHAASGASEPVKDLIDLARQHLSDDARSGLSGTPGRGP
jgi:DNA-binding transcriptional LysR family regulator